MKFSILWALALLKATSACSEPQGADVRPSSILDKALAASLIVEAREVNTFTDDGINYWDVEFEILNYHRGSGPDGAFINVTGFLGSSLCGPPPPVNGSTSLLFLCPFEFKQSNSWPYSATNVTNAEFALHVLNGGASIGVSISDFTNVAGELAEMVEELNQTSTAFGDFTIFECSQDAYLATGSSSSHTAPTFTSLTLTALITVGSYVAPRAVFPN